MSSVDERDLSRRVDGALATITSGPAPAAAIVARGRRIRRRRRAARAGVAVLAALAVAIPVFTAVRGGPPGRPARPLPTKMTGLPLPAAPDLKLLISTFNGAAWYSTATRRAEPIAGLPPVQSGYHFGRLDGGWWATQYRDTSRCPQNLCAGPPQQFYFIADGSLTATRIGAGYASTGLVWAALANAGAGVLPASHPGAVWLVTFPRSTAKLTGSASAQLVSTAGQSRGPRYRLPAGYLVGRGVGSYLLLVQNMNGSFSLWDPRTGRVARRFANVIAAGPEQIAWTAGCRGCRVQVRNVATGKTVTTPIPGGQPSALNATISDDGRLLAVQRPGGELGVFDTSSGVLTVIPGTALSSAAWQHFGWLNGGHQLIVTAGPNTQPGPAQVGYWRPGDTRLRIATIRNLGEISQLETGSVG